MNQKPVLIGQNNPLNADPHYALFPAPVGCTGHRVWRMLDEAGQRVGLHISRGQYLDTFERRNVLDSVTWSRSEARASAARLAPALADRCVVVLGNAALEALRLPRPTEYLTWVESEPSADMLNPHDGSFCYMHAPHPSGRCREYNDEAFRARFGDAILRLYMKFHGQKE